MCVGGRGDICKELGSIFQVKNSSHFMITNNLSDLLGFKFVTNDNSLKRDTVFVLNHKSFKGI